MTKDELAACSVLVVDDDELSRDLLVTVLASIGCNTVHEAPDARVARRLAQQHRPDFILLDIYMPDVDGWESLAQLRLASPQSLVIMVTGSSRPSDFGKSLDTRLDGYCMKPVMPDLMLKAMDNARRRSR